MPWWSGEGGNCASLAARRDDAGGLSVARDAGDGGKRNGKPFPSCPYLEEGDTSGVSKETPKKRQCFARKLLPRAAVHINPRFSVLFSRSGENICAFALYGCTPTERVARARGSARPAVEGRSLLSERKVAPLCRAHFVLSARERGSEESPE